MFQVIVVCDTFQLVGDNLFHFLLDALSSPEIVHSWGS